MFNRKTAGTKIPFSLQAMADRRKPIRVGPHRVSHNVLHIMTYCAIDTDVIPKKKNWHLRFTNEHIKVTSAIPTSSNISNVLSMAKLLYHITYLPLNSETCCTTSVPAPPRISYQPTPHANGAKNNTIQDTDSVTTCMYGSRNKTPYVSCSYPPPVQSAYCRELRTGIRRLLTVYSAKYTRPITNHQPMERYLLRIRRAIAVAPTLLYKTHRLCAVSFVTPPPPDHFRSSCPRSSSTRRALL